MKGFLVAIGDFSSEEGSLVRDDQARGRSARAQGGAAVRREDSFQAVLFYSKAGFRLPLSAFPARSRHWLRELGIARVVQAHNLAINNRLLSTALQWECSIQSREGSELVAVAGHQSAEPIFDVRYCPEAIPFDLESPIRIAERLGPAD